MKRTAVGLLAAGLICPVAASGGIPGVLGDLIGGKPAAAEFAGTWTAPPGSDIDHIVVTVTSSGPARIQVFGRCEARICNWGALPARLRTDNPSSDVVRALAADFNLGFALRHITLHRAAGNALRFDMVTEFTDGSERHDYESAGQLVPAGMLVAAAPTPAAVASAPTAAPAPVAAPAAAPPAAPAPGSGITALNPLNWLSSSKPSAAPTGPIAQDYSVPVGVSTAAPVDDCFPVDSGHAYIVNANGNWNVRDFLHVVQSFGPYRAAAEKGLQTIGYYHFDEICHIGRGSTNMAFFRTVGEIPRQPMPGQDCVDVHYDSVVAVKRDDDWKVVDGDRVIYDYGSDQAGAAQAASVIKSLALSRQCYYDRANLAASYWLSR